MSSEVIDARHLCRGKVFLYKQQLLSRFSNDHVPVQYGLDFSPKIKNLKSESQSFDNNQNVSKSEPEVPPATQTNAQFSPEMQPKYPTKRETYETVSKIQFQKSPPVSRKLVLISSKTLQRQAKTDDNHPIYQPTQKVKNHNFRTQSRPKELFVDTNVEVTPDTILGLKSPVDKNTLVKEYIGSQILSPPFEPEVPYQEESKKFAKNNFSPNRSPLSDRYSNQSMQTDNVDHTLVSVAQRAKSLMNNKPLRPFNRSSTINPVDLKEGESEESILSIKDRIRMFKENQNQPMVTSTCTEQPRRHVANRFKTQPLSFDDIARANAMILDQSEVASTIASPSITNSNETLVDFSEDSNSSSNKNNENHKTPIKLRKSNAILRAQSCLISQTQNYNKSIDEEIVPSIKVKDFIKTCDKKEEETIVPKTPKNAVVSRKLNFKNKIEKEESVTKSSKVYARKPHLTQPITREDLENSTMNSEESNQSIKDRIFLMQNNGENNWKNRVTKDRDINAKGRPGSMVISSLQEQLQVNNDKWKDRVEQKDVEQFTASSRLQRSFRRTDNSKRFTVHGQALQGDVVSDNFITRLQKIEGHGPLPPKQTLVCDIVVDESKSNVSSEDSKKEQVTDSRSTKTDIALTAHSQKVKVPQISDQSLSNFFHTSSSPDKSMSGVKQPTNDDFDDLFFQSDLSLPINKRSIKPTRKIKSSSRNPLKKLNERSDIKNEYDEVVTGVAERELKRCQIENIQSKAGFVEEALAALTTKEDFSKIKLKRTDSSKLFEQFISPFKDLMLISIKGRKCVQVRLVEPVASSINIGDCYLLITKKQVFVWLGECANIIETNKANELGSWIAKCKDLNYSGYSDKPIIVKSTDNDTNSDHIQFWKALQYEGVQKINPPGDITEDELYEQMIQRTNMVYKVSGNQLTPFDEYWGSSPRHKLLTDDQVYIFDFGTELYLWTGSKADVKDKSTGKQLLKLLYSKGYNYSACAINPLDPLPNDTKDAKSKKSDVRPNWVIVGRLPQKGETTLFKEKFFDWPESSRLIKCVKNSHSSFENKELEGDLQPVDIDHLLSLPHPSVHISIDGKSVGRGGHWKVNEDGILREFNVITKNIIMWHINDNEPVIVKPASMGQFCSSDAYIIRWDYELITQGRYQRNNKTGNLSSAFFFWLGMSTSITEKTASALLTVDLDKEHATQIRVKQHHESPAFCRLFDGSMVVYSGKQHSLSKSFPNMRLFILRGEIESEAHFIEVPCQSQSLRSRSSFLLLNIAKRKSFIWNGILASQESKTCANYCLAKLSLKKPFDLGINLNELKTEHIVEGKEPRSFWDCMGIIKKWKPSLDSTFLEPIRGWHVSAVTGVFTLTEMIYSIHPDNDQHIIPAFPLLQSEMYRKSQPALYLICTPSYLYIWEGWSAITHKTSVSSGSDCEDDSNMRDNIRLPINRIAAEKLALLKSVDSWLKKSGSKITASIIYAGLEPLAFQELFPIWEIHEDAKNINLKNGRKMYQEDDISETLHKYLTIKYSVDRLRERPLPEHVIPSRIESYLTNDDFEDLFKMTTAEFYELTPWRQFDKKKEVNLF